MHGDGNRDDENACLYLECATELPAVRGQYTHVVIRFDEVSEGTRVSLVHDGWGTSSEWDQAFNYFESAWLRVVLPRLNYRFKHGPIDWKNPPDLSEL